MAMKEYTRQELLDLLEKHTKNGKVSFDSFGEIVFDSRFPDHLFNNAKKGLEEAWNDEKRFKELANVLSEKCTSALDIQEKIQALKLQLSKLESEIEIMEKEFHDIKIRIDERRGK